MPGKKLALVIAALSLITLVISGCASGLNEITSPPPTPEGVTPQVEITEPPATGPVPGGGLVPNGGNNGPQPITIDNVERLNSFFSFSLATSISGMAFGPDNSKLGAATSSGVALLDMPGQTQAATIGDGTSYRTVNFSPDGTLLNAIVYQPGQGVLLWDIKASEPAALLKDELHSALTAVFSHHGTLAALGDAQGTVTIYDISGAQPVLLQTVNINGTEKGKELMGDQIMPVTDLEFSADDLTLAASSAGLGYLELFNVADGSVKAVATAMGHIAGPVATPLLSPADWTKVFWLSRGDVIVVDLATDKELGRFSHEDFIQGISISPDGKLLATASGATVNNNMEPVVKIWDVESYKELRTIPGFSAVPTTLAFSTDGSKLAVAVTNEGVQIWGVVQNQ